MVSTEKLRYLGPFTRKSATKSKKNPKLHFVNIEKQMVSCKSTAEEVSFEWSQHKLLLTDSKVHNLPWE